MEGTKIKICLIGISDESIDLNMDMMLGADDLFEPTEEKGEEGTPENKLQTAEDLGLPDTKEEEQITEDKGKDIFDQTPESVGKDEKNQASGQDTNNPESPSSNTISSMLSALKQDGILPDIDDKDISEAKTAEDFAGLIDKQVAARLDATQRRINEALDNGVPPDDVKNYEGTLAFLDGITEEALEVDDDDTDKLRRNLIYQDFINKGFKPERAQKEVEKSITAGTDVDDAKAARESVKEFFENQYKGVQDAKKQATLAEQNKIKASREEFRKKAMDTEEPFAGIKVDKVTRARILDNATKPIEKDANGNFLTPIQKYINENPVEAQYYMSTLYTLTDGFKNIDKLVGTKVKDGTKQSYKNLEKALSSSPSLLDSGNSLFNGGGSDDNSKITLDI